MFEGREFYTTKSVELRLFAVINFNLSKLIFFVNTQ